MQSINIFSRYTLGIDPGLVSGIAIFDLVTSRCTGFEVHYQKYGTIVNLLIEQLLPDIAIEAFIINMNTVMNTQAPWSLKCIGITEYLAQKHNCSCTVIPQSSAVKFATDNKLKKLGWYVPGKDHLRSAQRIALTRLVARQWWHPALDDL